MTTTTRYSSELFEPFPDPVVLGVSEVFPDALGGPLSGMGGFAAPRRQMAISEAGQRIGLLGTVPRALACRVTARAGDVRCVGLRAGRDRSSSCHEPPSGPNVSVTNWVSMYSRTSWMSPSWNRKTQQ